MSLYQDSWTTPRTEEESILLLSELALSHTAHGGSQGIAIATLVKERRFRELLSYTFDYETFQNSEEAYHCRQAVALFKKLEFLDIGVNQDLETWKKFIAAEEDCRFTNDTFRKSDLGEFHFLPSVSALLHRASRKVSRVLGPCPKFEELSFRFGPGATLTTKKREANAASKLASRLQCTKEFLPYVGRLLSEMPIYAELHREDGQAKISVDVVDDSFSMVPKDASIRRGITVGSNLTIMAQLAIGDFLKDRLLRFGIDISDQSQNQRLALQGSLDGSVATVDLVSASDCNASLLVRHLTPIDWYILMDDCRAHRMNSDYGTRVLEKFTTTGNGFTFPLETLVFWAICSSLEEDGDNFCSVYGDDIIVPSHLFDKALWALKVCGFTANVKKSFGSGPFRESCGVDGFNGFDIRPVYTSSLMCGREIYRLHNYYWRRGRHEQRLITLAWLPDQGNLYGPDGYGDGHLIGDHPRVCSEKHRRLGYCGYTFKTYKLSKFIDPAYHKRVQLAAALYLTYRASYEELVIDEAAKLRRPTMFNWTRRKFTFSGEPLPTVISPIDGLACKVFSLPGSDESYSVVSIYTF